MVSEFWEIWTCELKVGIKFGLWILRDVDLKVFKTFVDFGVKGLWESWSSLTVLIWFEWGLRPKRSFEYLLTLDSVWMFVHSETSLCGQQDLKIQLLTHSSVLSASFSHFHWRGEWVQTYASLVCNYWTPFLHHSYIHHCPPHMHLCACLTIILTECNTVLKKTFWCPGCSKALRKAMICNFLMVFSVWLLSVICQMFKWNSHAHHWPVGLVLRMTLAQLFALHLLTLGFHASKELILWFCFG